MTKVVPAYFVLSKYRSFIRQLSGWGFRRLHQSGADFGCYYHEAFLRDIPELTVLMKRVPANQGKPKPTIEGEPNFYLSSRLRPLTPPPRMTLNHKDWPTPATERLTEATSAATSVSQSVPHHMSAYDWSDTQDTMTPAAQADSPAVFSVAAATMSPSTSIRHLPFDEMTIVSSTTATMTASTSMPCIPSYETVQHPTIPPARESLTSFFTRTAAYTFMNHQGPPYQMENASNVQSSIIASAQRSSAPERFLAAPIAASTFVNHQQPSYQITNDAQSNSSHRAPHVYPSHNDSAGSSHPTSCHALASTAISYNNDLQYHGRGCNYYSTQSQPQPNFHQQDSATSSTRQQEHGDDSQESYEGDESFKDDMNAFFDSFQF